MVGGCFPKHFRGPSSTLRLTAKAAPTEPLTGVPQSEDASDVALYVQQSLTWATAVVDRARDQYLGSDIVLLDPFRPCGR